MTSMFIDISWPLVCCFKVGRYTTPARCTNQQAIHIRLQACILLLRQCEVQKGVHYQHIEYLVRKELLPCKLGKYKNWIARRNVIKVCKSSFPLNLYTVLFPDRQQRHITLLILLQGIYTSCFFLQEHVEMGTMALTSSTAVVHGTMDSYTSSC